MPLSPHDFGPIYAETLMGRFPVEPWNTFSNVVFLLIVIYFALKTRLNTRRHPLISVALPVILLGFIGGTIFHATRSDNLWLFLDFMPIIILAGSAAIYFWREVYGGWIKAVACVLLPIAVLRLLKFAQILPRGVLISLNYGLLAAILLLPAYLCCRRDHGKNQQLLSSAALSFLIALSFRMLDARMAQSLLPMGTHFLWHIFGGLSVYLLLEFVYRRDESRMIHHEDH